MAQNQHVCKAVCLTQISANSVQLWGRRNFVIVLKVSVSQAFFVLGCYVVGGK